MINEIAVMSAQGDTKTIWDSEKPDEVAVARETFDKLKAKGYAAFRVDRWGKKSERMKAFDSEAGAVIMVPNFAGG